MTDKSHKNFKQVRVTATTRAGDGRLAREGSVRNAPPLHRVICQATKYMYLEYWLNFYRSDL